MYSRLDKGATGALRSRDEWGVLVVSRWLEDSPENLLLADLLVEVFPDLKIVRMYRDPRDVVVSLYRQHWGPPTLETAIPRIRNMLAIWDAKRAVLPEGSFFEVRFEELVRDRKATLEKLCTHLEVEVAQELLDFDLGNHHIARFRDELRPDEIARVEEVFGDWMQRYDYPRDGA